MLAASVFLQFEGLYLMQLSLGVRLRQATEKSQASVAIGTVVGVCPGVCASGISESHLCTPGLLILCAGIGALCRAGGSQVARP